MKTAALVLVIAPATIAQAAPCRSGEVAAVRVTYDASMPAFAALFADWSEVQQHFPEVRGITRATALITPERLVEIDEGTGLVLSQAEGVPLKLRGRPYPFGYKHSPRAIRNVSIRTASEVVTYDAIAGTATRQRAADAAEMIASDAASLLLGRGPVDDAALPIVGKKTYAGLECTERRIPLAGEKTQACIREIDGWQVALYFQYFDPALTRALQWKRAVRIEEGACVAAAAFVLPPGTVIEDQTSEADHDQENDDAD